MLLARASSEAARYVAPDALMGMPAIYEELADADREAPKAIEGAMSGADGGSPPEVASTAQRKRKPARAALPSGPPAPNAPQPAQPAPVFPKISTAQRNVMFGLLRKLGKGDEAHRAEALELIGGMLEPPRKLEGTGELLAPEADAIIANLEALVEVASSDQTDQGEPGHAPKDASDEVAEGEVVADDQPKSGGDDWPPDTAGASANE